MFFAILEELNQKIDNCRCLPNASLLRVKNVIKELDEQHKKRICKELKGGLATEIKTWK